MIWLLDYRPLGITTSFIPLNEICAIFNCKIERRYLHQTCKDGGQVVLEFQAAVAGYSRFLLWKHKGYVVKAGQLDQDFFYGFVLKLVDTIYPRRIKVGVDHFDGSPFSSCKESLSRSQSNIATLI